MEPAYCLDRAEECELLAREAVNDCLARELRLMAADWRVAAAANDDPRQSLLSEHSEGSR